MRTTSLLLAIASTAGLLAGCSDSSPPRVDRAERSPSAGASAGPTAGSSATLGSEASPDRPTAGASAAAAAGGRPPGAQPPGAQPGRTSAAATAAPPGATAAGTYTYDTSGTVTVGSPRPVDSTSALTVDRPAGGQQHSVLEGEQGRTEQDAVFRTDGTFLARLSLTNPAFTKEFLPAPPVLLVPRPPTVGRTWRWTTTSTDGRTTAALTARIARSEVLTIGGVRTPTSVVESTLRLSGDVSYTGRMQTWYDAAHRLTVKERSRGSGTVGGIAFTTDLTSLLRSTKPGQ